MSHPLSLNATFDRMNELGRDFAQRRYMTIVVQGHVEKMEVGHKNTIKLSILAGNVEGPIVISATKEELAGQYLPGQAIEITVRPL